MKVKVIEHNDDEVIVTIHCREVTDEIKELINQIESTNVTLMGKDNNESTVLSLKQIYYFEAVDNRVFAYLKDKVYEVDKKIAELNNFLKFTSFVQTSRTIILNINCVNKIQTLVNGRLLAQLSNDEKMIITRQYAKDFKDKLKGGRR